MTISAAYRIGRVPALLSDVLISGSSGKDHQPIPTRVDLNDPLPLDWLVTVNGLIRKSAVICPNVAVAVAGNGLAASVICRELKEHFADQRPDAATFADKLSSMQDALSEVTRCTLVGWIMEDTSARSFEWDSGTPDMILWDQDFIIGSGADLFQKIAWSAGQRQWDGVDGFDHAQHYALTQVSSLLVNEISNGAPIRNLFGGGYDLLLWDGERFRHGGDVTFLFLSIEWLRAPIKRMDDPAPVLFRQTEVEDCLVMRMLLPANQLGVASDNHERAAVIAPITSLGRQHRLTRPHDWSEIKHFADRIFVVIAGTAPDGTPEHWSAGVRDDEARLFKLDTNPATGQTRFYLPITVMQNMLAAAERQFSRGA